MLPKEMSESSATDTPLEAAVVVTFVPPVTENTSDKKSMSSEPESPVTVIPEPTAAVVVPVIRPLASNVMIGIAVAEPTVAPVTTSLSLASGTVPEARSEASRLVRFAPLIAGSVAGNLASGTVPEARSDASRLVRFAPLIAGRVAGNLASGTVPEARLSALRAVSEAPEPLNEPAVTAPVTSRDPSVPTEVSEDDTMEEPRVVPLRTVVPFSI